jgi:hypothetical protein
MICAEKHRTYWPEFILKYRCAPWAPAGSPGARAGNFATAGISSGQRCRFESTQEVVFWTIWFLSALV